MFPTRLALATFSVFFVVRPEASLCVEPGVVELFDGKSLDGWTTAAGEPITKGWIIEDGALVRDRRGGSIYTVDEYGDFELSFQWKIAARGNSGVKYRVAHYEKGIWGRPAWLGCEYQLWDDDGRETKPETSSGSIYAIYAPSPDKRLRPIGEFNDSKIVAQGSRIEHWLNGEKVVEADTDTDDWRQRVKASKFGRADGFFTNARGRIELQDHGNRVWFRNIKLRVLDAPEDH
ncbi:MAG: DUF1080 domain-containing protein [Planctomycetota bacterium]